MLIILTCKTPSGIYSTRNRNKLISFKHRFKSIFITPNFLVIIKLTIHQHFEKSISYKSLSFRHSNLCLPIKERKNNGYYMVKMFFFLQKNNKFNKVYNAHPSYHLYSSLTIVIDWNRRDNFQYILYRLYFYNELL